MGKENSEFNPASIEVLNSIEITDVDSIADDIIADAPEVTESVVDTIVSNEIAKPELSTGNGGAPLDGNTGGVAVDKNGESFDPAKHQVDSDGNPRIGINKKLMLKRGRKAGQSAPASSQSKVFTPGAQVVDEKTGLTPGQLQQARITGVASAGLFITVSMALGGTEFAPVTRPDLGLDERAVLESGFSDYLIATHRTDLPPGIALAVVVSMYILPRLAMPKTQNRVKSVGGKIYNWWHKRKVVTALKKGFKEHGAQSDTGNDGKREVNRREKVEPQL